MLTDEVELAEVAGLGHCRITRDLRVLLLPTDAVSFESTNLVLDRNARHLCVLYVITADDIGLKIYEFSPWRNL